MSFIKDLEWFFKDIKDLERIFKVYKHIEGTYKESWRFEKDIEGL